MADESAQQRTIETFLRRNVAAGTKTTADIEAIALDAFAKQQDGVDVVEVTFEGGATRGTVNCLPHVLLAACETILAENDQSNPLANTSPVNRYADCSGGRIET